jgi:hypothetical protein
LSQVIGAAVSPVSNSGNMFGSTSNATNTQITGLPF